MIERKNREHPAAGRHVSAFQALLEGLPELVCGFGPDGVLTYANRACCESLGKTPGELVGYQAFGGLPGPEHSAILEALDSLRPEDPYATVDQRIADGDGGPRYLRCTLFGIFNGAGQPVEYLSFGRDVTLEKTLHERLVGEDRHASIGRLASGIVHELNNPIGAILLAAQSALRALDSDRDGDLMREALELVESEAMRCGRIVKSVVSFTRGGMGGTGDVEKAAENAQQLTRKFAAGNGVDVELRIPDDLPDVAASQTAVEQLLVILIRGAAETKGVQLVTVTASVVDGRVRVAVSETVIHPITPIRQDADLTILGELTTRLGGRLDIDADPGGGTRVTLDLPVAGPVPAPEDLL